MHVGNFMLETQAKKLTRICQKEYNNLSNHLKHAHKLSTSEVEELKSEKNQGKAKGNQENR